MTTASSGVLAGPKPDASHSDIAAIKDFTVVRYNNQWQVYATTASPSAGWNLVHFAFSDWPQAAAATHTYLDTATPIGRGYRAAPHLFYFAPQNLWYLVYQTGLPSYSTSTDPSNPRSWSAPRDFLSSEPAIVTQDRTGRQRIQPVRPVQFLYQGMDPGAGGDYIALPWRMGLLTQTAG